jgi:hypothetical protein
MSNLSIFLALAAALLAAGAFAAAWMVQAKLSQGAVARARRESEQFRAASQREADRIRQEAAVAARAELLAAKERMETESVQKLAELQRAEKEHRSRDQSLRDRDRFLRKKERARSRSGKARSRSAFWRSTSARPSSSGSTAKRTRGSSASPA